MMSYIGKCQGCQNVIAAVVDHPDYKKDTAKAVAEFIRDGLLVERVDLDTVKKLFNHCECKKDNQLPLFNPNPHKG